MVEEIDERTPPLGGRDVGAPEALPAGEGFVLASLGSPRADSEMLLIDVSVAKTPPPASAPGATASPRTLASIAGASLGRPRRPELAEHERRAGGRAVAVQPEALDPVVVLIGDVERVADHGEGAAV